MSISPNKRRCSSHILLWWILWLFISMVVIMVNETPRTIISILGYGVSVDVVVAFILGLIPFIFVYFKHRLEHPRRLFKTSFKPDLKYGKEQFGKPLILKVGQKYHGYFIVTTKKSIHLTNKRYGIRPQVKKSWYRRLFRDYNNITEEIKPSEAPPILVTKTHDRTIEYEHVQELEYADNAYGRWGSYVSEITINPSYKLIYEVDIEAIKP